MISRTLVAALCLYALLFAVYLFTFNGVMYSGDGQSMLAVTENLVKHGTPDASQLGDPESTWLGLDGRFYSKYPPGFSLLMAPLYWLALHLPRLGLAQTAKVLPLISTALNGVLVYLFVRKLGYAGRTGIVAALVFGLCTNAWVYSAIARAETTMGLGLFAAAYALRFGGGRLRSGLLAGLALGVVVSLKTVYVLAVPVLIGYALLHLAEEVGAVSRRRNRQQELAPTKPPKILAWRSRWSLASSLAVVVICLGLVGLYNYLRFGDPLFSGYGPGEGFTTPLAVGATGMLFGPYKSIFLFNPIYLLLPFVWSGFFRKHRPEALLGLALLVVHLVVFGMWWSWYAGKSWGPRFLNPLNPFLVVMLAPAIESALQRPASFRSIGFYVLGLLSGVVQFLGLTVGRAPYLLKPDFSSPWGGLTWGDWQHWPIIGHLLNFGVSSLNFTWAIPQDGQMSWNWPLFVAIVALGLLAGAALLYVGRLAPRFVLAVALVLPLVVTWFALYSVYDDPRYVKGRGAMRDNYGQLLRYLEDAADSRDALVLTNSHYLLFFLNRNKTGLRWYALIEENQPEVTAQVYALMQRENPRVWLATDDFTNSKMPAIVSAWLEAHGERLEERDFGDSVRLSLFSISSPGEEGEADGQE